MAQDLQALRIYALGLAHRAVGDISRDNFRQLRNYVDMCAVLANREGHKRFFEQAQNVLGKADSLYYPLIQRLLTTVSTDATCTFGVNLGVDALTYGTSRIKQNAASPEQPIPWVTVADAARMPTASLARRVAEGEQRGQFLYILRGAAARPNDVVHLASTYFQSDFAVIVSPEEVTPALAGFLAPCENIITLLASDSPELTEETTQAIALLKDRKMLYGLLIDFDDTTMDVLDEPEWPSVISQQTLLCVFTHHSMSNANRIRLYDTTYHARLENGYNTLALCWPEDVESITAHFGASVCVEDLTV